MGRQAIRQRVRCSPAVRRCCLGGRMFHNPMPRYEILSERGDGHSGQGLAADRHRDRRRVHGRPGGGAVPCRPGRRSRATRSSSTRSSSSSRSPRRRRSSTSRRATRSTASTSAATRWPSARSTGRRSSARARSAGTRPWTTSAGSPSWPRSFPELDSAGGVICEPNDTPLDSRHLDMTYALQTLTDKMLHGQRRLGGQRRRHDRDERDPVRRPRVDRADARDDLADQLQLAAALGRPDARRAVRVLRGRTRRS